MSGLFRTKIRHELKFRSCYLLVLVNKEDITTHKLYVPDDAQPQTLTINRPEPQLMLKRCHGRHAQRRAMWLMPLFQDERYLWKSVLNREGLDEYAIKHPDRPSNDMIIALLAKEQTKHLFSRWVTRKEIGRIITAIISPPPKAVPKPSTYCVFQHEQIIPMDQTLN